MAFGLVSSKPNETYPHPSGFNIKNCLNYF